VTSVVLSTPVERRKYSLDGKNGSKLPSIPRKRSAWSGRR
jgi:hypothetical protein